jgi:hypothetical protein
MRLEVMTAIQISWVGSYLEPKRISIVNILFCNTSLLCDFALFGSSTKISIPHAHIVFDVCSMWRLRA